MKATLVERTDTTATVRLQPNWLGRLFGARDSIVELTWHRGASSNNFAWHAVGTGRDLHYLEHRDVIRYALDFVPVIAPPRARVHRELTANTEPTS